MTTLMQEFRRFWYGGGETFHGFDRETLEVYGGPARGLEGCEHCQMTEWYSRVNQISGVAVDHECSLSGLCRSLCEKQGDDTWTHYHQDHWFAVGRDDALGVPHIAVALSEKSDTYNRYWARCTDQWAINLRRALARCGTVDVMLDDELKDIDWSAYDLLFLQNNGTLTPRFEPGIPTILYHHDPRSGMSDVLDWMRPAVILTPSPAFYSEYLRLPEGTRVMPSRLAGLGTFFSRPNLDPERKTCDLLAIGAVQGRPYEARRKLRGQLRRRSGRFEVRFHHDEGFRRYNNEAWVKRYLNGWSAFLGSARFVIFGASDPPLMVPKYSEVLGCGAVPILPAHPGLARWGVEAWEHYIPLEVVESNNVALEHILAHYDDHRHIAEEAVAWHQENIDDLVFGSFERAVSMALGS